MKQLRLKSKSRLRRLAEALLKKSCTVSELARLLPTNNPAEYVRRLRHDYGLTIFCEHVKFVTADGEKGWYGLYHLTSEDCRKIARLLVA